MPEPMKVPYRSTSFQVWNISAAGPDIPTTKGENGSTSSKVCKYYQLNLYQSCIYISKQFLMRVITSGLLINRRSVSKREEPPLVAIPDYVAGLRYLMIRSILIISLTTPQKGPNEWALRLASLPNGSLSRIEAKQMALK